MRAELAALLAARDAAHWEPDPRDRGRTGDRARRRRQRHRQDHDHRQARGARAGQRQARRARGRGHVPRRGDRPAPDLGAAHGHARSSPTPRTRTRRPSCSTPSTPPSRAMRTSSSPTPRAASTPSRTSWTSCPRSAGSSTSACPAPTVETFFVLDATTGQNGLAQAKAFHEAVGLTGVVLTKLDSTAKGGIVFAIEHDARRPGPLRRGGGEGRRPAAVRPRMRSSRRCSTRAARRQSSTRGLHSLLLGVARTRAPPAGASAARTDPNRQQGSLAPACSTPSATASARPSPG